MFKQVLSLIVFFSGKLLGGTCGDTTGVLFPSFELRAMPTYRAPFLPGQNFQTRVLPNNFQNNNIGVPPAEHHRTTDVTLSPSEPVVQVLSNEAPPAEKSPSQKNETSMNTVHDLLNALGFEGQRLEPDHERDQARASELARQYESGYGHSYPSYPEYGYHAEHPHGYWQSPYHEVPYSYHQSSYGHPPQPAYQPYEPFEPKPQPSPFLPKPLLPLKPLSPKPIDLAKPLSLLPQPNLNLGSKLPGLIGLVTNLLTGQSAGSGLTGLSATLNNLLRPLVSSNKNLKTLIGRLSVPLIILVLVNLEFLVLMWWSWEDCPAPTAAPRPAIYKPAYEYKPPGPYSAYYR